MSPRSFALALAGIAGLVAATPAAPVAKPKPTKLAILYARTEDVGDWLLVDADGTNPRPFLRPDGKREPVAVLPGQRPVVVSRVPGDTLTLLHPNGGDITLALTESPLLEVWRAWRWKFARDAVERALDPEAKGAAKEQAVDFVIRALGPLSSGEVETYSSMMWLESVSPDGTRVAFSNSDESAGILNIPAKKVTDLAQVVRNPKGSSTFGFRISPDWNWLEYTTAYDRTLASGSGIYVARLDGSCQTRVGDEGFGGGKRMNDFFQTGSSLTASPLPRARELAADLKAEEAVLSPDCTVAILERDHKVNEPSRFSVYELRTKREVPLPAGFGTRGCDDFRWVRVPADRD